MKARIAISKPNRTFFHVRSRLESQPTRIASSVVFLNRRTQELPLSPISLIYSVMLSFLLLNNFIKVLVFCLSSYGICLCSTGTKDTNKICWSQLSAVVVLYLHLVTRIALWMLDRLKKLQFFATFLQANTSSLFFWRLVTQIKLLSLCCSQNGLFVNALTFQLYSSWASYNRALEILEPKLPAVS